MSTYKVATTVNSESTMHTIIKENLTTDHFSYDESFYNNNELTVQVGMTVLHQQIFLLNTLRDYYLKEEDTNKKQKLWRTIIQLLPSSYMQKRTWTGDYAILRSIISQRTGHRLNEWKDLIHSFNDLPYAEELLFY